MGKGMTVPVIVAVSAGGPPSRCGAEPASSADSRQCAPLAASTGPRTTHSGDIDHALQPGAVRSSAATVDTNPSAAPAASSLSISHRADTLLPYDSQRNMCNDITFAAVVTQAHRHLAASLSTTAAFGPGSALVPSDTASPSATIIHHPDRTEIAPGAMLVYAYSSDFGASVPAPFNLALDVAPPPKQPREVIRISPRTILRTSAEGLAESCRLEDVPADTCPGHTASIPTLSPIVDGTGQGRTPLEAMLRWQTAVSVWCALADSPDRHQRTSAAAINNTLTEPHASDPSAISEMGPPGMNSIANGHRRAYGDVDKSGTDASPSTSLPLSLVKCHTPPRPSPLRRELFIPKTATTTSTQFSTP